LSILILTFLDYRRSIILKANCYHIGSIRFENQLFHLTAMIRLS
jgi:hypothetical protein